jgi:hypothetical protein
MAIRVKNSLSGSNVGRAAFKSGKYQQEEALRRLEEEFQRKLELQSLQANLQEERDTRLNQMERENKIFDFNLEQRKSEIEAERRMDAFKPLMDALNNSGDRQYDYSLEEQKGITKLKRAANEIMSSSDLSANERLFGMKQIVEKLDNINSFARPKKTPQEQFNEEVLIYPDPKTGEERRFYRDHNGNPKPLFDRDDSSDDISKMIKEAEKSLNEKYSFDIKKLEQGFTPEEIFKEIIELKTKESRVENLFNQMRNPENSVGSEMVRVVNPNDPNDFIEMTRAEYKFYTQSGR